MKKYSFNRRQVTLNITSGVFIGLLGLAVAVLVVSRAPDFQSVLFGASISIFLVWVAVSGIHQVTRGYHIEDDGLAIHKVFPDHKRISLRWDEVEKVTVRRYRNQVVLANQEGTSIMVIDTQLVNFAELFGRIKERFPDLPYRVK